MPQKFQPVSYPSNVPELLPSLPTNETIRRLKLLFDALRDTEQDQNEATKYKSLAVHLSTDFLMHNQNAEVKILVACCVAEILRIFAPDAPYGDPHQLKTVLMFLIKQLRGLDNPKDAVFVHYYLLLENLSIVKTLNIVLELEESPEFVLIMIKLFFAILQSDDIPEKVQGMLIEILISIIKECDHLSVSALDALLVNLVEPHKTQNRVAYRCARDVIDISGTSIHPFLESYLLSIITEGKNAESTLGEYVFEITYEIQKIMPAIIVGLNAQLEDRIKSSDVKDRLETVRLLARLFSDKGATVFTDCPTLWTLFLSRFNDISPEIRLQCLKSATELLLNHLTVRQDICEALIHRFRDTDDNVRTQAITTMMTVGKKDFSIISEEILNCIKDRTLDKKFKVRREALLCLGSFYRKMITNPDTSMTDFKRVMWIKNKILHAYYQQNLEDKILCEKLFHTCLVPFFLPTESRTDTLYQLYCTIDENAAKAFNEIFRQQSHMRHILRAILTADGQTNPDEAAENQLNRLRQLSEFFLDTRAFDNLKSFYDLLLVDTQARKYMNYIINDDFTAEKIQETVKSMLEKVGPRSKYFNIHGTVRSLLERSAPVGIDRTCVEYLLGKIRRNSARLEFAMETDVSDEQISERGYHLMLLLASSLPTAFYSEQCLTLLLEFLREGNTLAADSVIQIFTKVGRRNEADFAEIYENLLPELEKISEIGTEKQAKHAITCINKIWPNNIEVLQKLFDAAVKNVDFRNVYVQPAFATLSSIARIRPKEFREKLKSIVSVRVVKNVILNNETHTGCTDENENDTSWIEPQHLSIEAKAKVSAVKFLAYRILGMKTNDDNHAINTLKLLNGIIESGGNLQDIRMRYVDKAYMRLTAGCFFLKLMREKMFVDLMPLEHYANLCYLITDDCSQVRAKFAAKLHKNLYSLRLPLEMMAALCLVPLIKLQDENLLVEKEFKNFKTQVRDSILLNYRRRKEYLKKNTSLQSFPWKYLPEYYVSFCIYLLAHHSEFESYDDTEVLKDLKECMWFALEPMVNRKDVDKANAPFLYRIMENVKHARDAMNPDDVAMNKKLWAVCDLGMSLIKSRTPNFDSKPLQYKPLLSKRFFAQNKRGTSSIQTNGK